MLWLQVYNTGTQVEVLARWPDRSNVPCIVWQKKRRTPLKKKESLSFLKSDQMFGKNCEGTNRTEKGRTWRTQKRKEKAAKVTEKLYGEMECAKFILAPLTSNKDPPPRSKRWESRRQFHIQFMPKLERSDECYVSSHANLEEHLHSLPVLRLKTF